MEIFHQCFQYTPSNFSDFIEFPPIIYVTFFADKMFKSEVIGRYLHNVIQKKNAQISIYMYFLAYLNIGHCAELTFLDGKFGRFLILTFFIWILHFESESKSRFNSDEDLLPASPKAKAGLGVQSLRPSVCPSVRPKILSSQLVWN